MSHYTGNPAKAHRLVVPMRPRSPNEAHRASTPLELLFDLVYVVAVSQAAAQLHHGIAEGHVAQTILRFAMVFFAIWWGWVNFTWFASAYDTDDVPYRLAVFVQLTGALILAAGVPAAFELRYGLVTAGYAVMRLAAVEQWLRAAQDDPSHRTTARRYAFGITLVQVGWIARLALPESWQIAAFLVLVICEFAVPVWAEQATMTSWHASHIAERYGLFTIIVLGESILSATLAAQSVVEVGDFSVKLTSIIIGGLLIIFSMWWLYFDLAADDILTSPRMAFVWGYGHFIVFASAAAVGAGIAVAVDHAMHHAEIGQIGAGAAVTIPVALYLISLRILNQQPQTNTLSQWLLAPSIALLVLVSSFSTYAVLLTGILLATLVAIKLVQRQRAGATM